MKKLVGLALTLSSLVHMHGASANQDMDKSKPNQINERFLQIQVEQNVTIGKAIKVIVSHYPQQAASIVDTALDLYPSKYKEIIHAAISAQPTLAEEVVTIALSKGISSCTSIVETAINADPSYIDFVVTAAAHSTPEELNEIVRIAVITEPDSADYIVQSLAKEHPSKIVEILQSAIGAVPFVGEYVVEALLAVFPNDAEMVITTAVRESSAQRENVKRIIETAQNSGIDIEKLEAYAIKGGATTEELSQVLDNKE
ncbi:hypothetical protein [Paraglaciecola arctica]|uniref:Uncharacterized protein n=1 Tax=Paraglaciecola arctica BSs20135 TaxID=493475 RepID=K6YZ91_9ALTE|nr:hypothetical protein [Paraglaciecola arctica]GAC22073.1 hypothetical protein GARC_5138 [Paraglaciecola arctica BSs20135]